MVVLIYVYETETMRYRMAVRGPVIMVYPVPSGLVQPLAPSIRMQRTKQQCEADDDRLYQHP